MPTMGLIYAFIIGATKNAEQAIETRAETMDLFFWVLMVALACFVFGGFIWHPRPL